jgi:hypothetical protein
MRPASLAEIIPVRVSSLTMPQLPLGAVGHLSATTDPKDDDLEAAVRV